MEKEREGESLEVPLFPRLAFSARQRITCERRGHRVVFFFAGVLVIFAGIVWSIKNLVKCALCNVYPLLSNHAFCLSSKALKNASCISLFREMQAM